MVALNHSGKLNALADPRRREIFEILAFGPQSVAQIAQKLPVTRPAVSQHLKVLMDAGLVTFRPVETRHLYRIDAAGVLAIRDYFDHMWRTALESFKQEAELAYVNSKDKNHE
jgi:DNA-binding transcriptional ArsR family regulator